MYIRRWLQRDSQRSDEWLGCIVSGHSVGRTTPIFADNVETDEFVLRERAFLELICIRVYSFTTVVPFVWPAWWCHSVMYAMVCCACGAATYGEEPKHGKRRQGCRIGSAKQMVPANGSEECGSIQTFLPGWRYLTPVPAFRSTTNFCGQENHCLRPSGARPKVGGRAVVADTIAQFSSTLSIGFVGPLRAGIFGVHQPSVSIGTQKSSQHVG